MRVLPLVRGWTIQYGILNVDVKNDGQHHVLYMVGGCVVYYLIVVVFFIYCRIVKDSVLCFVSVFIAGCNKVSDIFALLSHITLFSLMK